MTYETMCDGVPCQIRIVTETTDAANRLRFAKEGVEVVGMYHAGVFKKDGSLRELLENARQGRGFTVLCLETAPPEQLAEWREKLRLHDPTSGCLKRRSTPFSLSGWRKKTNPRRREVGILVTAKANYWRSISTTGFAPEGVWSRDRHLVARRQRFAERLRRLGSRRSPSGVALARGARA